MPEQASLVTRYPHEAKEPLRRKLAFVLARIENTLSPRAGHPRSPATPPRRADLGPRGDPREPRLEDRRARADRPADLAGARVRLPPRHARGARQRPELHEACRALLPGYAAAKTEERRARCSRRVPRRRGVPRPGGDRPRAAATFDTIATRSPPTGAPASTPSSSPTPSSRPTCCARCGWRGPRACSTPAMATPPAPLADRARAAVRAPRRAREQHRHDAGAVRQPRLRRAPGARKREQEVMLGYSDAGKDEATCARSGRCTALRRRSSAQARARRRGPAALPRPRRVASAWGRAGTHDPRHSRRPVAAAASRSPSRVRW